MKLKFLAMATTVLALSSCAGNDSEEETNTPLLLHNYDKIEIDSVTWQQSDKYADLTIHLDKEIYKTLNNSTDFETLTDKFMDCRTAIRIQTPIDQLGKEIDMKDSNSSWKLEFWVDGITKLSCNAREGNIEPGSKLFLNKTGDNKLLVRFDVKWLEYDQKLAKNRTHTLRLKEFDCNGKKTAIHPTQDTIREHRIYDLRWKKH